MDALLSGSSDTKQSEDLFGEIFVHRQRRCSHPTTHVGRIRHLEQTLHRAVLAVGPVENGKGHVELDLVPAGDEKAFRDPERDRPPRSNHRIAASIGQKP